LLDAAFCPNRKVVIGPWVLPWAAFGGYLEGLERPLWQSWASRMQPLMVFGGSWATSGVNMRRLGRTGAPNLHKAGRTTPFIGPPWFGQRPSQIHFTNQTRTAAATTATCQSCQARPLARQSAEHVLTRTRL